MPTRADVLALAVQGVPYEEIGERLGILPGLAYLVATGVPADGSDVLTEEELAGRPGIVTGSTQHLANPAVSLPKHQASVEAWMRARAVDDRAMQEADAARSAEPPPVQGMGETEDVISVLGWDHNQVKFLLEELQAIPGVEKGGSAAQRHQRRAIVDMITVRLSQHEVAEEGHFWPAVRDLLPGGDQLVDKAKAQEQRGKEVLHELGRLTGDEERFDDLVEELVLALRVHVAYEDTVFLRLEEVSTEEQRAELGRAVLKAKGHAPTRPHPHAPNEGLAARLAAASAAPLDKARDALGHRPAETEGRQGHQAPRPSAPAPLPDQQPPANESPASEEATPEEQTPAAVQARRVRRTAPAQPKGPGGTGAAPRPRRRVQSPIPSTCTGATERRSGPAEEEEG